MNSKVYKWCAVPQCKNTSITTPNKVFVHVPYKKIIRDKWLKLARRNPNDVKTNSPLYFCEDHFDRSRSKWSHYKLVKTNRGVTTMSQNKIITILPDICLSKFSTK
ncbi:hypothetical protein ABMA28_015358 [Loxostege sticticalis]|uniref:THAP-type domain-containing protein n=1 Tax=Loxostege sticticalis TaxID=481309 RepID=A0ABD0T9R9_LOXSC